MNKTPVCAWCGEEIKPGEESDVKAIGCDGFHKECGFRQIAGSAGHILERCPCFGGAEGDPPGMTRREAAKAAVKAWMEKDAKRQIKSNGGGKPHTN